MADKELSEVAREQLGRYIVAVARRLNRTQMMECMDESFGYSEVDEWAAGIASKLTGAWQVEQACKMFRDADAESLRKENGRLRAMLDSLSDALSGMRQTLGYFEKFQADMKKEPT